MKQTNHTPESFGKEKTAKELDKSATWFDALEFDVKDYLSKKYFGIELNSISGRDFIEADDSQELTISMVHQMYLLEPQQQTDKLYTREEAFEMTRKAIHDFWMMGVQSSFIAPIDEYHPEWFNQNYPK